jgi:hypothetical protein
MAVTATSSKRRESVSQWFKQLLIGQEQQGTAKAAAAAWLGTIYSLRAASRMDGNKEWGRIGDDMITCLEMAYIDHMGKDGAQAIEMGRRLLRTDEKPEVPKMVSVPKASVKFVRPTMPKLPHMKHMPHIRTSMESRTARRSASSTRSASTRPVVAAKSKVRLKSAGKAKAKARR